METERLGIDYVTKLSYTTIDKSNLNAETKRNLLFSVYSFRCLFDNAEMLYVNPILKKNLCTFSLPLSSHPLYNDFLDDFKKIETEKPTSIQHGGLYVQENGNYVLRFDAGSEVFNELVRMGKLTGPAKTVPSKFSLYNMVYEIISLENATTELKAMWFLIFPYIILMEAPHEPSVYYALKEKLYGENIFETVIDLKYSVNVPDTVKEMWADDYPNILVDFLLEYIEWKNAKNENGISRETARFQKWLNAGRFSEVYMGSEKLLNTFPDDDDLMLVNIASRISLEGSEQEKEKMLKETLLILDDCLDRPSVKKILFIYYYGVALIGLKRTDEALDKFEECLEINPKFEPAIVMKKALTGALNNNKLN